MTPTKSFLDMEVWKKSHILVLDIYKMTKTFPKDEIFGLTSQIRRAGVSIAANLVEGYKRKGKAEKLRFYNISQASLEEVKYLVILSKDLKYIETDALLLSNINEIGKMLETYINKINKNHEQQKNHEPGAGSNGCDPHPAFIRRHLCMVSLYKTIS